MRGNRLRATLLAVAAILFGLLQPSFSHGHQPAQSGVVPILRPGLTAAILDPLATALTLRPSQEGLDTSLFMRTARSLEAPPFRLRPRSAAEQTRAVQCLANAVYYEAALEPLDGQRAVAQVVVNRVRNPAFPHSVCAVVYQGWERSTGCQFSFTCDGSLMRPPSPGAYALARAVAEQALNGYVMKAVGTATHYHAVSIDPWWRPTVVRIAQVGSHVFYRWPGSAGLADALRQPYRGGEMLLPDTVIDGRRGAAHTEHASTSIKVARSRSPDEPPPIASVRS